MRNLIYLTVFSSIFVASGCAKSAPEAPNDAPVSTQTVASNAADSAQQAVNTPKVVDPFARGKSLYRRCQSCHTLAADGKDRVGPNLWNIMESKAGAREGFAYSKAFKASEITWTDETLSAFLENPRTNIPGNRMTFAGFRKVEDRDAVIAYLRSQTTPAE